ncbi:MAG TPA: hypothetical protein VHC49_08885 [Mycobacteriales bacterium]|nr:hypothetical protein [Mycobacteriales bacterium]
MSSPRREYLEETIGLLWPQARTRIVREPPHRRWNSRGYLILPNAAEPRLLVPAGRRIAAAAMERYSALRKSPLRVAALRSGLGAFALSDRLYVDPGPQNFETYAAGILDRPVRLSLHVGPPRANRKPVVQLLDRAGNTLAFGKIGRDALTDRLVDAEAAALSRVSGLPTVRTPVVIQHGRWQDRSLLLQSPLPAWRGTAADDRLLITAMREIVAAEGIETLPLENSRYLCELRDRIGTIPDPAHRTPLNEFLTGLLRRSGGTALPFGCWHGDLTPWNVAAAGDRMLVWDWERFAGGVPVGFDALHYDLQQRLHTHGPAESTAREFIRAAPKVLDPWDGPDPAALAALYLIEIGTRYAVDGQRESGSAAGDLQRWLIPALTLEGVR